MIANSNVTIDNRRSRVTEWVFEVGDETGKHSHEYDYIVVPMVDGESKIINEDGSTELSKLVKGYSYYRNKGVSHNVLNNNDYQFSFVEIEIK